MAVVSRIRQESSLVGSDGGVLSSTVVPQVQAVFPEGALQKRIRVGLQVRLFFRLPCWFLRKLLLYGVFGLQT